MEERNYIASWEEVMDFAQEYTETYIGDLATGRHEPPPDLTVTGVAIWCLLLLRSRHPAGLPFDEYREVVAGYVDSHINGTFTPDGTLPTQFFSIDVSANNDLLNHPKLSPRVRDILRERGLSGPQVHLKPELDEE